ncbi:hypothetical protein M942_24615 [Enterobacter ludwigii]|nr:hypothetical protein M942_24615 [Enterobacter ludwigii]KLP40173.1 hypothetical protein ABR36_09850 [Enterobacter ludwigii]
MLLGESRLRRCAVVARMANRAAFINVIMAMAEQTAPPDYRRLMSTFSPGWNIRIGAVIQTLRRQMQRVIKKIRALVWRNATTSWGHWQYRQRYWPEGFRRALSALMKCPCSLMATVVLVSIMPP